MKKYLNLLVALLFFIVLTSFKTTTHENKGHYNYNTPLYQLLPQPYSLDNVSLKVNKGSYTVSYYYRGELLKTYPCVFGKNPLEDKQMKGDYRTPEGTFKITNMREHFIWGHFIGINYPNEESWAKFNYRRSNNLIPANAEIGGSIGFHGVIDGLEFLIDERNNWTEGCVSLKNSDINELVHFIKSGVEVEIRL